MTKEMYKELCEALKRRNTILLVVVIVLCAVVIGVSVFAFSQFEINYEDSEEYDIEYDADVQDVSGNNNTLEQSFTNTAKSISDIAIVMICLIVLVFIIALTIIVGVYLYGKNKSEYARKIQAFNEIDDTEEKSDKEN